MKEKGQALIEFALVFPLFIMFVLFGVEMFIGLEQRSLLSSAVREGAALAASGASETEVVSQVSEQAGVPVGDVTVSYADTDGDGIDDEVTVSAHDAVTLAGGEIFGGFGIPELAITLDPSHTTKIKKAGTGDPFDNDVLFADNVPVGDHVLGWLGAYEPALCEGAVIYIAARTAGLASDYDLKVAPSDDGVTPGPVQNVANGLPAGANTWTTTRRASATSPADGLGGYNEGSQQYLMVGAFANAPMRFMGEVHCQRDYP